MPDREVDCRRCRGTGIGRHGPPDVSRCSDCGGRGYHVVRDMDEEGEADDAE